MAVIFAVTAFYFTSRPAAEIIQVSVLIMLAGAPIDVSIWFEKFLGIKKARKDIDKQE